MADDLRTEATIRGGVHSAQRHDSAHKHVTGAAEYTDDIAEPVGTLHAYLGLSDRAHAEIVSVDLDAVRAAPGVVDVLTAADIPHNDVSPVGKDDDPVFAEGKVEFHGQPMIAVIAETRDAARRAAALAKVAYRDLPHVTDVAAAVDAGYPFVTEPLKLERGEVAPALAAAPHRLKGRMRVGGQDHFYLEGMIAFAVPGEDDEVTVYSSTQHPSEVQHMVAHVLGVPSNAVTIIVRRMGGGFGGKETQPNLFAAVAAVAAKKWGRAVKIRPDRDDDMVATGKRHDFLNDYDVGFDDDGRILAVDGTFAARCGFSADLSGPVTDRALFHADNAYYYPAVRLVSKPMKTNTVSNTAFRGFGGPQGLIIAERIMEEIAYSLGKDPLEVRRANFYGEGERNVTPYHQTVTDNVIGRVVDELVTSSGYAARRQAVLDWNAKGGVIRKGIALTPVKFGISFTATWYNQAGALVHVYNDGSIHLNHGGTEMGQGLNTKVSQVVADVFQVDLDRVKITATTTAKVPNTSATAASSGSDLNGMAAQNAAEQIRERLIDFAAEKHSVEREQVVFEPNVVRIGNRRVAFDELIREAYLGRVHLSAAGFYKTPEIHWDRAAGKGRPFYYFAYGAAVSEVSVDTLTGEYHVDRTDILHDVGRSLNPAVDRGQVEGGFIQGMGWLTTEELWWDDKGRLRTHAPSTYKIPLASDRPAVFNVKLADWSANREPTIRRSKAVGEPPFMLAVSVLEALSMAVASVADYRECPRLDAPATPERVLMAMNRLGRRLMAVRPEAVAAFLDPGPAMLVRVVAARGSTPREAGAWMLVSRGGTLGTIGGGQLEYMAIDAGRALMARGGLRQSLDVPLGPEIGQCCGGRTRLSVVRAEGPTRQRLLAEAAREWRALPVVHVLGAGHVGRALAAAMALLPVRVLLVDSRAEELGMAPDGVEALLTPLPEEVVRTAARGGAFVVLTHDHALDFLIVREALARGDAAYVGMIGSRTKRASFRRWLAEAGEVDTDALVCPIGAAGRPDKRPEVIAAFVAAEVMQNVAAWQDGPTSAHPAHAN